MTNVLIAGCGYVGTELGMVLRARGHAVWGLRRNTDPLPPGITPFAGDLTNLESLRPMPAFFDYVYYTAGADAHTERAYRSAYVDGVWNLLEALQNEGRRPKRIFFTSSTGIYPQDHAGWVDEDTPADSTRFAALCLVEAETLLHANIFPATAVRLGGLYGPGRTRLLEQVRHGEARRIRGREIILNLIHRDDAAGALAHLMTIENPARVYNAVDDEPVDRNALLCWLAAQAGTPEPPFEAAHAGNAPVHGGNRRVCNTRLRESGYRFTYPTYRDGYGALISTAD